MKIEDRIIALEELANKLAKLGVVLSILGLIEAVGLLILSLAFLHHVFR